LTRDGVAKLGLSILPERHDIASNTVTAVRAPGGVDEAQLLAKMRQEYDIVLAGGQQSLHGQTFVLDTWAKPRRRRLGRSWLLWRWRCRRVQPVDSICVTGYNDLIASEVSRKLLYPI
jgi:hypothetical protein